MNQNVFKWCYNLTVWSSVCIVSTTLVSSSVCTLNACANYWYNIALQTSVRCNVCSSTTIWKYYFIRQNCLLLNLDKTYIVLKLLAFYKFGIYIVLQFLSLDYILNKYVLLTLLTVMTPSWVFLSVEISNTSKPSPLTMVKYISAFLPMSLSMALTLPTGEPYLKDSGTRNW